MTEKQIKSQLKAQLTGRALRKAKFRARLINDPDFAKMVNENRKTRALNNNLNKTKWTKKI